MASKIEIAFKCDSCGKLFSTIDEAKFCESSHLSLNDCEIIFKFDYDFMKTPSRIYLKIPCGENHEYVYNGFCEEIY